MSFLTQLPLSAAAFDEVHRKVLLTGEQHRLISPLAAGFAVQGIDLTGVAVTQLSDEGRLWQARIGYEAPAKRCTACELGDAPVQCNNGMNHIGRFHERVRCEKQ